MPEYKGLTVKLEADASGLTKELSKVDGEAKKAEAQLKLLGKATASGSLAGAADKLRAVAPTLERVGSVMSKTVTPAIVGIGAASVATAVKMDSSMTSIRKTVDGTEEDYQRLKDAAIEFSKTNAVDPATVMDVQALGAQLGFTIDELDRFSQVATGLDIATDMNLEDGASQMAQFANITGMAHDDIERYASAIVELGNTTAVTESAVSNMAQRVAAAGSQVGMSQADILGWSGAMAQLGISAEAGGTAFSVTISDIDKAVATGGSKLEAFAKVSGKTAEQFAQDWSRDSSAAFMDLLEGLSKSDNMSVALEELGITAQRQTDVMKRLAGATDQTATAIATANRGWDESSALSNEVANRNESLAAKFQILKNRVTAVADSIGAPLADALLDTIDAMEPLLQAVSDGAKAFSEMDEGSQRAILALAGFAAMLGPMLTKAGAAADAIDSLSDFAKKLGEGLGEARSAASAGAAGLGELSKNGKAAAIGLGSVATAAGLVAAALVIKSVVDYCDHLRDVQEASIGVAEAQERAAASARSVRANYEIAGAGAREAAKSYQDLTAEADSVLASNLQLASSLGQTWGDFYTNEALLGQYVSKIEELGGSGNLTASQMAELSAAVEGYNSITGDNLSILDAETGALSENSSEVRRNADEWLAAAKKKALGDSMVETQKQIMETEKALDDYQTKISSLQESLNMGESSGASAEQMAAWRLELDSTKTKATELQAQLNGLKGSQAEYTQQLADSEGTIQAYISSNSQILSALNRTGLDIDTAAAKFEALGFSVEEFGAIAEQSPASLATMATGFGKLEEAGVPIENLKAAMDDLGLSTDDLSELTISDWQAIAQAYTDGAGNVETQADNLKNVLSSKMGAAGRAGSEAFKGGIDTQAGTSKARSMANNATSAGKAAAAGGSAVGSALSAAASGGINAAAMDPRARSMANSAVSAGRSAAGSASSIGSNFSSGASSGISLSAMVSRARRMVANAISAAKAEAKIASPSRVMMEVGGYFSEGFAIGIDKQADKAARESAAMVRTAISAAEDTLGSSDWSATMASANLSTSSVVRLDSSQLSSIRPSNVSNSSTNISLNYEAGADASEMARDIARNLKRYQLARGE